MFKRTLSNRPILAGLVATLALAAFVTVGGLAGAGTAGACPPADPSTTEPPIGDQRHRAGRSGGGRALCDRCRGVLPQLLAGRHGHGDDGNADRHPCSRDLRRHLSRRHGRGRRATPSSTHRRTGSSRRQHVRRRRRFAVGGYRRRPRVDVRPRRRHRLVQRRPDVPRERVPSGAGLDPTRGVDQRLHLRRRAGDRHRPRRQRRVIDNRRRHGDRSCRRDLPPARRRSSAASEHHVRHRYVGFDGHPRAARARAVVTCPSRAQPAPRRHDRHRHLR